MAKKEMTVNPNSVNSIAESTNFEGTISTQSDINIKGNFKGTLNTESKFVLGQQGVLSGEVHCKNALISGKIKGKIVVKDLITIQSSAVVDGDISAKRLVIEVGAKFNGNCLMKETTETDDKSK